MKIVSKPVSITAYTTNTIIKGLYQLNEDTRLSDVLNAKNTGKEFLPIKDATVTNINTKEEIKVPFLSLNRNSIEIIFENIEK